MEPLREAGASEGVAVASGLEGVRVADTRLSEVDGERGHLIVAGHDVEALALRATFEDVCALLWDGALPDGPASPAREAVRVRLAEGRVEAFARLPSLGDALAAAEGMDALRAAVAHHPSATSTPAKLAGALVVYAAAWSRRAKGEAAVAPDPSLRQAEDFLRMVSGIAPTAAAAGALDVYLVTVADHGMNASTFAARVVTSTGSDLVSAVVAAIGALKGPLHGGAPGPVLDMLDAIGQAEGAERWIDAELAAGRRIMGMGHRIYRVRDPRAAVLERAASQLEQAGLRTARLALARAVERVAEGALQAKYPALSLRANVEFYTAVLLDAVGLPRTLFSTTFAAGRIAGWCAHVAEQRATGRLIRPESRYVGPRPPG